MIRAILGEGRTTFEPMDFDKGPVIGFSIVALFLSIIAQVLILPFENWNLTKDRTAEIAGLGELRYEIQADELVEGTKGSVTVKITGGSLFFKPLGSADGSVYANGDREFSYSIVPTQPGAETAHVKGKAWSEPSPEKRKEFDVELGIPYFVSTSYRHRVWLTFAIWIPQLACILAIASWVGFLRQREADQKAKIIAAEQVVKDSPTKAQPIWALAQARLESYFDRNLIQVNQVFVVAIAVMIIGFAFVLYGVAASFHQDKVLPISQVSTAAGIITEFIGATFMAIYRSTMSQANDFTTILERINTVGMSIQVLDTIPDTDTKLKNDSRARIVELLLLTNVRSRSSGKKTEGKSHKIKNTEQ